MRAALSVATLSGPTMASSSMMVFSASICAAFDISDYDVFRGFKAQRKGDVKRKARRKEKLFNFKMASFAFFPFCRASLR
jgi:hypothetical protein